MVGSQPLGCGAVLWEKLVVKELAEVLQHAESDVCERGEQSGCGKGALVRLP